jgi:hypothetical protein
MGFFIKGEHNDLGHFIKLKAYIINNFSKICEKAYLMVYCIKRRRLQDIKTLFKNGVKQVIHKNKGMDRKMVKTTSAIGESGVFIVNHTNMGSSGQNPFRSATCERMQFHFYI